MNLTQLLQALSAAVQRGDRPTALELARQIQQRLATEAAEHAALERQMRALLAELDAASPLFQADAWTFDPLTERGALEEMPDNTPARCRALPTNQR